MWGVSFLNNICCCNFALCQPSGTQFDIHVMNETHSSVSTQRHSDVLNETTCIEDFSQCYLTLSQLFMEEILFIHSVYSHMNKVRRLMCVVLYLSKNNASVYIYF